MADLIYTVDYSDVDEASKSLNRLEDTSLRTANKSVALTNNKKRLNKALKDGVISVTQYNNSLKELNRQQRLASNGLTDFRANTIGNTRSMNAFGMGMQQTGYQVGDFLVQVQSGTNAMVAFGQQATQLVGILPMFAEQMGVSATRMIAISAGLGIAIPLVTAIGAALMRTRTDAKEADEAFEGLGQTIDNLSAARLEGFGERFARYAQEAREEFETILSVIEQVESRALAEKLAEPLRQVAAEIDKFDFQQRLIGQLGDIDFDSALGLESRSQAIFLAEQLRNLDGQTKQELQGQLEGISEAIRLRGIMTDEVQATLVKLAEEISLVDDIEAGLEDANTAAELLAAHSFTNISDAAGYAKTLATNMQNAAGAWAAFREYQAESEMPEGMTTGPSPDQLLDGSNLMPPKPGTPFQPYNYSTSGSSGGSGGGGSAQEDRLGSLAQSLLGDQEKIDVWYQESLEKLQEFNAKELEILGGHNEAKERLEVEYHNRLRELDEQRSRVVAQSQQRALGAFQSFMGTLAGQSEGAAKAVLVVNTALQIAQAIQNTAAAATKALAIYGPTPAGFAAAAAVKKFGAVQVGLIAANAALKLGSGGSSSGGGGSIGGGGGAASSAIATPEASPGPQRILIEGLSPTDMLSGEMLQELFDKFYDENEERGAVFVVST